MKYYFHRCGLLLIFIFVPMMAFVIVFSTYLNPASAILTVAATSITSDTTLSIQGIPMSSTGTQNTFIGNSAGTALTSGNQITAVGYGASGSLTSAVIVTALGYNAGNLLTTGCCNNFFGAYTGEKLTTGTDNTFVGMSAGRFIGTGSYNTCVGDYACNGNSGSQTGFQNSVLGWQALFLNQGGSNNEAVGLYAGYSNTSGTDNASFGVQANYSTGAGSKNVAIGTLANSSNSSGNGNIAIGWQAANNVYSGSNNITIGYNVNVPSGSASNLLNIGNLIFGTGLDGTGVTISTGNIGIGTASPGARLDVKGHIASSQATAPTASVTGTGYSGASMGSGSTDTKGSITATVGANAGTLVVTFNAAYTSAPYCAVTPANAAAQVDEGKMYITKSTSALTLNFVATPTGGSESWDYICIQ